MGVRTRSNFALASRGFNLAHLRLNHIGGWKQRSPMEVKLQYETWKNQLLHHSRNMLTSVLHKKRGRTAVVEKKCLSALHR